jgi:hypothetical protein
MCMQSPYLHSLALSSGNAFTPNIRLYNRFDWLFVPYGGSNPTVTDDVPGDWHLIEDDLASLANTHSSLLNEMLRHRDQPGYVFNLSDLSPSEFNGGR